MRWQSWLVLLIVVVGLYWLFARGANHGADKKEEPAPPVPVSAAIVAATDLKVYLNGLGTVTPLNTVTIKTRVDGALTRILFREGEHVKAGELLAQIDPRPFQVQLAQAQGQMARDQSLLSNAQRDLNRYRKLYKQDSIAQQQLTNQESLVHQYEGAIKVDQGQIDNAKLQLDYSRITAPISGRIGLRQVDLGNIVHAADPNGLAVITQLQPITVLFNIPEDQLPALLKRMRGDAKLPVQAYNRDGSLLLATGSLYAVDNQIDTSTGMVRLKAMFQNREENLFPNQFVNARMLLDVQRGITAIPQDAVMHGAQGDYVWIIKPDDTVTTRAVTTGISDAGKIAIRGGLRAGEKIVVDGAEKLTDGAKVSVKDDTPHPAAALSAANSAEDNVTKPHATP
jgi:multidrug efflux system membrane fusion protein